MNQRLSARDRITQLTDAFDERDARLKGSDPLAFEGYEAQLAAARDQTGLDEACVWGNTAIGGVRCALVVFDFGFLGGSMGVAVGEKVARAFDAARRARTPVVTVTASGGARMQEGMWALVQMAKTVEARRRHAAAGLPHLTLLTSPTTGGVYASFASLADVVYAEPSATIGFAGPRIVEQLTGDAPLAEVHTAEFAFEHGLIDGIAAREEQRELIGLALRALTGAHKNDCEARSAEQAKKDDREARSAEQAEKDGVPEDGSAEPSSGAWARLQQVRDPGWPKGPAILDVLLEEAIELRGDRTGAPDDEAVVVRAGRLRGTNQSVVAVGQNAVGDGRIRPEGFRKAIRAIELGGRLRLPVLTLIDTRGADPLASSEASGVAVAIAGTFEAMLACPAPTLAVLTGEGGSGGALAMAIADRVLAWPSAVFSVIAPEGAAAILYRDTSRAPELAERMRIGVPDLIALGLVDAVIPRPPDGVSVGVSKGETTSVAVQLLADAVGEEVERLAAAPERWRLRLRHRRWREIARPSVATPGGR